jgi:hypothetical protein
MSEHIIGIVMQDLGNCLSRKGQSNEYLDFETGKIVPASECPAEETGQGRAALHEGKRFIRIPAFDEAYDETLAGDARRDYLAAEKEFKKFQEERKNMTGLSPEVIKYMEEGDAILDALLAREPEGPEKDALVAAWNHPDILLSDEEIEWREHMRAATSAVSIALRWIASLEPPFRVLWLDESENEVCGVYRPETREWDEDFDEDDLR